MTLSQRGARLVSGATPEYLLTHFERSSDRWDPKTNPNGYLGLCVAENGRVWDLIGPRVNRARTVPARAFAYDSMLGSTHFRERLAAFLGERLAGRDLHPEQVSALSGAGTVLESLFYTITDPGDAVLVPTPSYAGFWHDLETRIQSQIIPVHGRSDSGFEVSAADLEAAYTASERPVRALLLTNPDNPRGAVLAANHVERVLAWAESRDLHVVVDEVYAFSVFPAAEFRSVLRRRRLGPKTHVVWAFSKDFAASGLRCGVLVSENEEIRRALDSIAYWGCVSGDTQCLLSELLDDRGWLDRYLAEMPRRLVRSYENVTASLAQREIPFSEAQAGFFLLGDFRRFLRSASVEGERELWRRMVDEANVSFTPGAACRIAEPGFMRICHAAVSDEAAREAVRRVVEVVT